MDDGKNFWRQEGGDANFFLNASWEIKFFLLTLLINHLFLS